MQIKTPSLKHTLYFIFSLWIIFLIWYGRGYFCDEAPDAGREAFYAGSDRHIPDETNAAVGISGLNAPIDANSLQFGRAAMIAFFQDNKNLKPSDNTLKFISVSKENAIDCKLPDAVEIEDEVCTRISEVGGLVAKNSVLIKRYTNLYNMHEWQDDPANNGQNLIHLNRLIAANVKLLILNTNYDAAYFAWRDNHIFISRILHQENTMITRAIFQVLDGINLASLENLLYSSSETAAKYNMELSQLLKPQGLARYNISNMLRAEYRFFNNHLLSTKDFNKRVHVEYMRNRLYYAHLEFLQIAQLPAPSLNASRLELKDKYIFSIFPDTLKMVLPHGLSNMLINQIISGTSGGLFLVSSMHSKSAKINLLHLMLDIQLQNINSGKIQTFLNDAGKDYECPFTETPMVYDAIKKTIYYENPESKERVAEVRL